MYLESSLFYNNAMKLFQDAGHTVASSPLYLNHTYKQVIYFDSEKSLLADRTMLSVLEYALEISHLFDLSDELFETETGSLISYYSIVLGCEKKSRSQMAHDIHFLLHSTFTADISILLFKCENSILLSVAGVDEDIILSDWFHYFREYDQFIDLIHIAQLSINSIYEFMADLVYLVARDYYLSQDTQGIMVYNLIPSYYFCDESSFEKDFESLKELIRQLSTESQLKYGEDYVEPVFEQIRDISSIDAELDMLSFELDLEEDVSTDIIEEEDANAFNEEEHDEYEFDDVDPEIFNDPSLMLKWIENEN